MFRACLLVLLGLLLVLLTPSYPNVTNAVGLKADVIAVWQHQDLLVCSPYPACIFDDWDIWYSFWDGTTGTWWTPTGSQAAPLARIEGDDVDPAVAFDRNGNAMLVWAHNQTQQFDIYYSIWNGAVWSAPSVVDGLAGEDTDPAVAFDKNGYALAVWVHDGSSIYYALWNGAGWVGHPVGQRIVRDWPSSFNGTSLPELAFTNTPASPGSYTSNQGLLVWTQLYQDPTPRSRIFYDLWNGASWSLSPPVQIPGQVVNTTLGDGPIATYRNGLSPGDRGDAVAVWGTASPDKPLHNSVWNGTSGTWGGASSFTTKGTMPAIAHGPADTAIAIYSTLTAPGQIDLWGSGYSQGVWAPGRLAADSSVWDRRASIASFGTRAVVVWWVEHPTFRNSEVFYAVWNSSYNSWTPASSLVGDVRSPFPQQPSGLLGNDRNPAVASSAGSPSMPLLVHDVAVTQIDLQRTIGYNEIDSNPLEVMVIVANKGTSAETVTVEFSVQGGSVLSTQTTTVGPGASQVLIFELDPQPLAVGSYTLLARAVPLTGEIDILDNSLTGGPVAVHRPGDVDGDADVDIVDAATLAFHYGTICTGSLYLAEADLDNDCDVDILDAATLAFYFGQ